MRRLVTIAMAFVMTLGFGLFNASSASASTLGNRVYNDVYSDNYIQVTKPNNVYYGVQPGHWSNEQKGLESAQAFHVIGGCWAVSQWGYKYAGNKWWPINGNYIQLRLHVDCYI